LRILRVFVAHFAVKLESNPKDFLPQRSLRKHPQRTRRRNFALFAPSAVFRDVHDFVFKDKQIGLVFASQTDHVFVVIFDPASDHFSIRQLDAHRLLFFSERLQVGRLLRCLLGRGRPSLSRRARCSLSLKRHSDYFTRRAWPCRQVLVKSQIRRVNECRLSAISRGKAGSSSTLATLRSGRNDKVLVPPSALACFFLGVVRLP